MDITQYKPCPCCGNDHLKFLVCELGVEYANVYCPKCQAQAPQYTWNKRPAHEVGKMVNRFLGWRLPENFAPDCGITFKHNDTWGPYPNNWPIGTNLFTADQALAMLEHVLSDQTRV